MSSSYFLSDSFAAAIVLSRPWSSGSNLVTTKYLSRSTLRAANACPISSSFLYLHRSFTITHHSHIRSQINVPQIQIRRIGMPSNNTYQLGIVNERSVQAWEARGHCSAAAAADGMGLNEVAR